MIQYCIKHQHIYLYYPFEMFLLLLPIDQRLTMLPLQLGFRIFHYILKKIILFRY